MAAGDCHLLAAFPKSSAERAGKSCESRCVGSTVCSALTQSGLMETIALSCSAGLFGIGHQYDCFAFY